MIAIWSPVFYSETMRRVFPMLLSVGLCEGVGTLGSIISFPSLTTWYVGLRKPAFSPPNAIFGPVWTILFALMGVSAYLLWQSGFKKRKVKNALAIFATQLVLNFLWSYLFFGLRSPVLAFIEIIFLWTAIFATIVSSWHISKTASILLIPYLFWVTFALILTYAFARLNY